MSKELTREEQELLQELKIRWWIMQWTGNIVNNSAQRYIIEPFRRVFTPEGIQYLFGSED